MINPIMRVQMIPLTTCAPRARFTDWAHDHNNGMFGTTNACGTMDHDVSDIHSHPQPCFACASAAQGWD